MKTVVLVALVLVAIACNDERRLQHLLEESEAAERDVRLYRGITPATLIGDSLAGPEKLARVTKHYNAIREDSLPAAERRTLLARRELERFLRGD